MAGLTGLLIATGFYPLWRAWQANRQTSLAHAVAWAAAAWAAWLVRCGTTADAWGYLALCLTGCAGVAVLGARRPGLGAWNFVVASLLIVLLLPLAEGGVLGAPVRPGAIRIGFLAATLTVALGNYLPTRLAPGMLLLAAGCLGEMLVLFGSEERSNLAPWRQASEVLIGCAPWAAWASLRWRQSVRSEVNCLWLDFRDRFGAVWGLRLREQFNRAAANAGWPVVLDWSGLIANKPVSEEELRAVLCALLKRFGPEISEPEA
jgi:hypothetical protein